MSRLIPAISIAAGALWLSTSFAQVPSDAPAGTTGQCKDGSYTSGASKPGACRGHQGVQAWYVSTGAASSSGSTTTGLAAAGAQPTESAPATAPAGAAPTDQSSQNAAATASAKGSSSRSPATMMPGGGSGTVWVNKNTHVYHCHSDKLYGKTKKGAYMSETDAKAEGDHPIHNRPCT